MTLEEFADEQRRIIESFEQKWKLAGEVAPISFPNEMDQGEWDEALYMFDGNDYDTDDLE